MAQSHKNAVRSTYGAELFAVTSAADSVIPLLVTVEEFARGLTSLTEAKRLPEEGGWCFESMLVTDSMSLFQSATTRLLSCRLRNLLLLHLFWLRELIRKQILTGIKWCDTRDMTADGHTKGSVSQDASLSSVKGQLEYKYAVQDSVIQNITRAKQRIPDERGMS